jgi:tetrahydrodipicolinate N-succinyltransferase
MIDSHALVGSCAQIGERVHVSAAAQIGGVLEPLARCRWSSRTMCSLAATAACMRARS